MIVQQGLGLIQTQPQTVMNLVDELCLQGLRHRQEQVSDKQGGDILHPPQVLTGDDKEIPLVLLMILSPDSNC